MNQELGFFYDTIHGRISLGDLPTTFHLALKAVLSSPALDRLKRISQLGHTSLSYFSATHTRFSHALGTMLVMNKLFMHIEHQNGLPAEVLTEVGTAYPDRFINFDNARDFIHCHLLLAAMYQDVGELPFQKITSHFFRPADDQVRKLEAKLTFAKPTTWSSRKNVFSLLAFLEDTQTPGDLAAALQIYSLDFLVFLITGDGCPSEATHLEALRQMVDGGIDADRLDYVYRDASVTIGSLSRPTTVLESISAYKTDHVVVADPRPIVDFLSTRMRLWTFVYSAPDVRFRQALLKTFLEGRFDYPETPQHFEDCELWPVLNLERFLKLDDHSITSRIDKCLKTAPPERLHPFRIVAANLLLSSTLDYECRILEKPDDNSAPATAAASFLPDDLFFDLFCDHVGLLLHREGTIRVQQSLTVNVDSQIAIERTSGALSPLFTKDASALLVPKSFYVFRPRKANGGRWPGVNAAMDDKSLYWKLRWAAAERALACKTDTQAEPGFDASKKALSISYCSTDFEIVARLVQELYRQKRRYRLFLRPFDGTGNTPAGNSANLITEAEAVIALASVEYISRATDQKSYISIEVRSMNTRAKEIPVVPLGIDELAMLNAVPNWDWSAMNEKWRNDSVVIPNKIPLKKASDKQIQDALAEAFKAVETWKP